MRTRRHLRRTICTAVLGTALSHAHTPLSAALEISSTSGSIQQVQYQPGQPSPPSSGVSQELKKLFDAEGRQMPSMQPQDLPNAQGGVSQNGPRAQQIRQPSQAAAAHSASGGQSQSGQNVRPPVKAQTVAQSSSASRSKSAPPKRNLFQKFADKLTGEDKRRKAAEAAVVPPVPPGYQESKGTAATHSVQTPQGSASGNGNVRQPATAAAGQNRVAPGNSATSGTTGNAVAPGSGNRAVAAGGTGAQAAPGNPAQQNSASTHRKTDLSAPSPRYVQPGAAPAFMQPQSGTVAGNGTSAAAAANTRQRPPATITGEPAAAPPSDDDFVDPFQESPASERDTEVLDLDALVLPPTTDADSETPVEPADSTESGKQQTDEQPLPSVEDEGAAVPGTVVNPASVSQTSTIAPAEPSDEQSAEESAAAEANPFTGVRLPATDGLNETPEPAADPGPIATPDAISVPAAQEATAVDPIGSLFPDESGGETESTESLAKPNLPMQDFGSDLPDMTLPPAEFDPATVPAATVPAPVDLNIPAEAAPASSEEANTGHSRFTSESTDTPAGNAAVPAVRPNQEPVAENSEVTHPQPLRSIDAERLQQAANQERQQRQQRMIAARAGQAGFKGFCPVALRDRRELVDAKPEFTASFGLQSYSFSSLESRLAFESDPSRYAPAAGGSDVVLLVNSGEEKPGMLDFALWHRDRLYLFCSRETMTEFSKDPKRFASQY